MCVCVGVLSDKEVVHCRVALFAHYKTAMSHNQRLVGVPLHSRPTLLTDRLIDAAGKCDRCLGYKASLGLLINENGPVDRLPSWRHCSHAELRLQIPQRHQSLPYFPSKTAYIFCL